MVGTRLKWVREIDGGPASTTDSDVMAALQKPKSLAEHTESLIFLLAEAS